MPQYMWPPEGTLVDVGDTDYSDKGFWKELNTENVLPYALTELVLVQAGIEGAAGSSEAYSLLVSRSDVVGGVKAWIQDATVNSDGDIEVLASEISTLSTSDTSTVQSWGTRRAASS